MEKKKKKELDRKAIKNANDEQINDNKKGQREYTLAIRSRDGQCKGREVICMGGKWKIGLGQQKWTEAHHIIITMVYIPPRLGSGSYCTG